MSPWTLYALSGAALFSVGLSGLFSSRNVVRRILAANTCGAGVLLLLVALARRVPGEAPDPVPHALVLTGIVVSVSATALAVNLARRVVSLKEEAPASAASSPPPGEDA